MVLDCVVSMAKGGSVPHAKKVWMLSTFALDDINWFRNYKFWKKYPEQVLVKDEALLSSMPGKHTTNYHPEVSLYCGRSHHRCLPLSTNPRNNKAIYKVGCDTAFAQAQTKGVDKNHPFFSQQTNLGIETYGSPTTSDQAWFPRLP